MHLIAPITLAGVPRCPNTGKTTHTIGRVWRTPTHLLDGATLNPAEADDAWTLYEHPTNYAGGIQFGTCCISTLKLRFAIDADSFSNLPTVEIQLNGAPIWVYTKPFLANPSDPNINAIYEDVTIDLVTGSVTADAIRGPNNPGGAGAVHTANIGTATPFTPARDRPCGNLWEISAAQPTASSSPVFARVAILDIT